MKSISDLICDTADKEASSEFRLPYLLTCVFSFFHKGHRIWRWYRRIELYRNPNNFLSLTTGHVVGFYFSDSLILRIAAQAALISSRMIQCIEQQAVLNRSWLRFVNSFKGSYNIPVRQYKSINSSKSFLSPSTFAWLNLEKNKLSYRIQRVFFCLIDLSKNMVFLSMKIIDVIESFYFNEDVEKNSKSEFFVNIKDVGDKIFEKKESILDILKNNDKVIKKILLGIGSPISGEFLINAVANAFEKTEKIHKLSKNIQETVGEFALDCLKKWGHELGIITMDSKELFAVRQKYRNKEIALPFPRVEWITKPSKLKEIRPKFF